MDKYYYHGLGDWYSNEENLCDGLDQELGKKRVVSQFKE